MTTNKKEPIICVACGKPWKKHEWVSPTKEEIMELWFARFDAGPDPVLAFSSSLEDKLKELNADPTN